MKDIWEYKCETTGKEANSSGVEIWLNDIGSQGWELITVYEKKANPVRVFIFKRKITNN